VVTDLAAAGRVEEVEDWDVMGENVDCAELGRSGMALAAAAARLCAAIASRTEERPLKAGLVLLVLETEDASEDALGLFWSFSSKCFDFVSRVAMILDRVSVVGEKAGELLTLRLELAISEQKPSMLLLYFP
jgi:hypothetical protein